MRIERFPAARAVTAILWLILAAGVVGAVCLHWRWPARRIDERATLTLLRSEAMAFLVTRRTSVQIVVEYEEEDWAGRWRGCLWAVVHMHHGLDLRRVQPDDIRRDGDVLIVRLPQPEFLNFAVEPGSVGILCKSTAVPKIADILNDGHRRELEKRLRQRALEFVRQYDLAPSKEQIVAELNGAAAAIEQATGVKLRFE